MNAARGGPAPAVLDAWHLPGLEDHEIAGWDVREYEGGVSLRFPLLEPDALAALLRRLKYARADRLAPRRVAEIVRVVDAAAERLTDADDPHRRMLESALPAITGYTPEMIRLVLDRMAADWRADALGRLLDAEFADPGVLDGFRPRTPRAGADDGPAQPGTRGDRGMRVRAFGPELAVHIFSGNVPGVAVTSLVRSLLVKAATFGKSASGEPLFASVFARMIAEEDPGLGECLGITYWPGGSEPMEAVAMDAADAIVVYGGESSVRSWRKRALEKPRIRLVTHGPRLSFALIGRRALTTAAAGDTATSAARAIAIFDQQGCVSPHVIYVERGGMEPARFAGRLAEACDEIQRELPRGRLAPAEAARIHEARAAAEFRDAEAPAIRLFADPGLEYTIIYDEDPAFTPSCLNRVAYVKPVDSLEDAVRHVEPFARYLQTVGIAGAGERTSALAGRFGALGASRVTGLERMPWPPPAGHHDGRGPLRELIRWVDLED